jgi:hypothetical protein
MAEVISWRTDLQLQRRKYRRGRGGIDRGAHWEVRDMLGEARGGPEGPDFDGDRR